MRKLIFIRRLSQIIFFCAFVYILWSTTYPLRGFISPQVIFKIDPLIMFLTALSERLILPGLLFSLGMVGLTFVLGRFFCGWVCPMGTIIDIAGRFKIRLGKIMFTRFKFKARFTKHIILGAVFIFALFGIQTAWVLDPIVTTARVISLNVIPSVTMGLDKALQFLIQKFSLYGGFYDFYRSLKSGILGVNAHFFANSLVTLGLFLIFVGAAIFATRFWCRFICPLGALYALNASYALLERKAGK
ncbi:MAG: 4Fe-4S binding protein, partial [Candidatus Omnitrophica bacterium]|nr:4Fe-4S binding protein [Candidatus Omnitrophota bacterium]